MRRRRNTSVPQARHPFDCFALSPHTGFRYNSPRDQVVRRQENSDSVRGRIRAGLSGHRPRGKAQIGSGQCCKPPGGFDDPTFEPIGKAKRRPQEFSFDPDQRPMADRLHVARRRCSCGPDRRLPLMEAAMARNEFAAVTPGEMLKEEFMSEYGLSQNRLAKAIGISPNPVTDIGNTRRRITADTAPRLALYS